MPKFLLLLGVSGVGKSTIINILRRWDENFVYISPYMTRPLRDGEKDKISIADDMMDMMASNGDFLNINTLYSVRYATPRKPILQALITGKYPVLDWPIDKLAVMKRAFPGQLHTVYLEPPTIGDLRCRLSKDSRDKDGARIASAIKELARLRSGEYDGLYDLHVLNDTEESAARIVLDSYLSTEGGLV